MARSSRLFLSSSTTAPSLPFSALRECCSFARSLATHSGDWNFLVLGGYAPNGTTDAQSSPGFFLFNKAEYDAQPAANRITWLKRNATVVIVNANTGGVLR